MSVLTALSRLTDYLVSFDIFKSFKAVLHLREFLDDNLLSIGDYLTLPLLAVLHVIFLEDFLYMHLHIIGSVTLS